MGSKISHGFTIIEAMLFLAITGLLISGVLVSASNSINDQHYREGVESLRSNIQAQYSKVYSLTNSNSLTADDTGDASDPCSSLTGSGGVSVARGTSDCFYVGRLIQITPTINNQSRLKISPVVAKVLPSAGSTAPLYGTQQSGASAASTGASDIASKYQIALFDRNASLVEDDVLDWGLAAVGTRDTGSSNVLTTSVLVLRSPIDGTVQTYVVNDDSGPNAWLNLQQQLDAAHRKEAKICLADLSGATEPAQRTGIIIHQGASGPGDIETLTGGSGC